MSEPRVLTVQPPWSWAIAHGDKNVDNRTDCKGYTGELFIQAGRRWSDRGEHDRRVRRAWRRAYPHDKQGCRNLEALMLPGRVVAVCQLSDCHDDEGCCRPWGESQYQDARTGKLQTRLVHMVFENVVPIRGPLVVGRMGLWRPDRETVQFVREQLS